ncbi:LysM peptidoglycan-binding domain-containing protein [bacterium]|nr:LysM peptidoglycan-binding domain-containing protein [bacterium]
MNIQKTNKWLIAVILMLILGVSTKNVTASTNNSPLLQSGGDVIAAINGYRAAYGLAQLSTNAILTSVAQSQANYQASIDTVTHTGAGGTTARDRAAAAGYNDGNILYLSEIIYGGWDATVSTALTWWQNSSIHNSVMLAERYTEIGAGVAVSGNTVYFTAVLATPSGTTSSSSAYPTTSSSSSGEESGTTDNTAADVAVVIPVQMATPQADGSIVHEVQEGQTIWTIEAVYGLESGTLQQYNDLPSYPYVFPGDLLIIRPAGSYEAEGTTTPNETTVGTPSDKTSNPQVIGTPFSYVDPAQVTPTPPIVITKPVKATATSPTDGINQAGFFAGNSTAKTIVIIALLILVVVLIGSMFLQKPPEKPEN